MSFLCEIEMEKRTKTKKCSNANYSNAHFKVAKGEEVGAVESVKAASEVGIQSLEIIQNFFENIFFFFDSNVGLIAGVQPSHWQGCCLQ